MISPKVVLISGAGIAGLTTAWHLSKIGWQVVVVEKSSALRTGGYMISLSGPGYTVAKKMAIEQLLEDNCTPLGTCILSNKDGKELWRVSYPDAFQDLEWVTMARTTLVDVLYQEVKDKVDIRFGVTPIEIISKEKLAQVKLSDGTVMAVDLFIGADGVRSSARELIFGKNKVFTEPMGYRCAAFQLPNTLSIGYNTATYGSVGRVTEIYSLGKNTLATLYLWKDDNTNYVPKEEIKQTLLNAFEGLHPNQIKAIYDKPEEAELYFDSIQMVKIPKWYSGRCLLMGDSAHCLTLASGQGASIAMTSAAILSEALIACDNIDEALIQHDVRLRPIVDSIQARTKKIIKGYVPSSLFTFWLRNLIFKYMSDRLIGRYLIKSIRKEAERTNKAMQ